MLKFSRQRVMSLGAVILGLALAGPAPRVILSLSGHNSRCPSRDC